MFPMMGFFIRRWDLFITNIKSNGLVFSSGLVGVPIFLSGLSNMEDGNLWNIALIAGPLWFLVFLLIGLLISIPRRKLLAKKLVGQVVSISDIPNIHPGISKLGILGVSNVGKSTLKDNLVQKVNSNAKTQDLSVVISISKDYPHKYFGIIDGAGDDTPMQCKILENSDYAILVFDHNFSDKIAKVDDDRLREISNLNNQLRNFMNLNDIKVKKMFLLLNKEDLWTKNLDSDRIELQKWFLTEVDRWKNSGFAYSSSLEYFSNRNIDNLNSLIQKLI